MKKISAPLLGLALSIALLAASMLKPSLTTTEGDLGTNIRFSTALLNEGGSGPQVRAVHPSFTDISGWLSAVGASVGAADFDGNGIADEVCLVDPRDDSVRVLPIPGSASTQVPLSLEPAQKSPAPAAPMGCLPADLNLDGQMDVLVYYWGRSPVIFYSTDADPRATELVSPVQVWNSTTATVGDLDGNGTLDVVVGNYFPDGARVLDAGASDDDRMSMQASMSLARNGGTNRFLLSVPGDEPDASFLDVSHTVPAEASSGWTLAFGLQDLTGNALPDLYIANDFGPDHLLVNRSTPLSLDLRITRSPRNLGQAKSSNLGHDSFKGMGVTFTTLPGHDAPSIAVSNITQPYGLQESNFLFVPSLDAAERLLEGEAAYNQMSEQFNLSRSGWSWDIRATDFNADGVEELVQATGFVAGRVNRWAELQELAMTNDALLPIPEFWMRVQPNDDLSGDNPNRLWCLQPDVAQYRDCAPSAGIASTEPTRAFATTDFDGDARMDLIEANQWAGSRVHRNVTAGPVGLLVIPMLETAGGRLTPSVGAVVEVTDGTRRQRHQVYPANGHTGVSSTDLIFAAAPNALDTRAGQVTWRDLHGNLISRAVSFPPSGRVLLVLGTDGEVTLQ